MARSHASTARQVVAAVLFAAIVAAVAMLGSVANAPHTDDWYAAAEKVLWSPPNWVFAPVWSLLYALIAAAGWLIWRAGYRNTRPNAARGELTLYVVQLALNALWSPLFFAGFPLLGEVAWWMALVDIAVLLVLVVWLGLRSARWSPVAAWIMLPYALWLAFATTLNIGVIALN